MSTPVVRIDGETREMETRMVSFYGMKTGAPYYFYNVLEELDTPGEWYLDRESGLLYWYPSMPLEKADVMLSLLTESILTMKGVSHVTLKGITFTGNEHQIEYNEIYAVCKTSDDAAVVYSGRDYRTQGTVGKNSFSQFLIQ
jgi:hypothetical protein